MRALEFDFRREDTGQKSLGVLLLLCALASALALGMRYQQIADELAMEQASMRNPAAVAGRPVSVVAPGADAKVSAEYRHASEIVNELTRPWGELFASAESAITPDVALLSIESDVEKRRVKIAGEAKNLESVLEYLRALSSRPALAEVYLESHELQRQDPQRPVRFVLSAQWAQSK